MAHKCNLCKRTFKSAEALAQHLTASHKAGGGKKSGLPNKVKGSGKVLPTATFQPFMGSGEGRRNLLRSEMAQRLGTTSTGSTWALRYLHPCDETRAGGERIPDTTSAETTAPELRAVAVLGAPDGTTSNGTWDCAIIHLPVPELAALVLTKPSSWSSWTHCKAYNFPSTPIQTTNKGQGWPSGPNQLQSLCDEYRQTFGGLTVHLNSSQTTNQGRLYASQWAQVANITTTTDTPTAELKLAYTRTSFDGFPLGVEELVNKSSKYVQWEAREGCYMPLRFVQPTSRFEAAGHVPTQVVVSGSIDSAPFYTAIGKGDDIIGEAEVGAAALSWYSRGLLNTNCGVIFAMGLSPEATLDLKVRRGLQAVPSAGSPWGPFMEDAPRVDNEALSRVVTIAQEGALAYPARYNDLGLLWSHVLQPLLKGAVRWVAPLASRWANS